MEIWNSKKTLHAFDKKRFIIGAGSNKAMIRPVSGAATFYATPGDAAASGDTILLCNDSSDDMTLPQSGSVTLDPFGFNYTGTVSAPEGYFIKSAVESISAAYGVESAPATTYVVAQKVAGVGGQFYDNLAEAVEAANGAMVTLYAETAETITLTEEGQSFTLNKNGIAFDDAKVVTTIANGSVTKSVTDAGTVYTAVTSIVDASDGNKYASVGAAVAKPSAPSGSKPTRPEITRSQNVEWL